MKKTISVFGSSLPVEGDPQYEFAYKLGVALAKNNFNVCNGGYSGIMDAVSKGASENGAEVTGVLLDFDVKDGNKFLTNTIVCSRLLDRVEKLMELGDGYVILQGGTGTLLELAAVWEFINKEMMPMKPIACHSNMWKTVAEIIDDQLKKEKRVAGLVNPFDEVYEIVDYLKTNLG